MTTDHETYRDNLAAYALEALDHEDIDALEDHLRTCDACRADLKAYRNIKAGLLFAVPAKMPPTSLRRRLQRQLPSKSGPLFRSLHWSWNQALAAGAFVLLIGLGLASIAEVRQLREHQAEIEDHNRSTQTLISMLAYPTTETIRFEQNGIAGSALIDKDRGLMGLFVWHLAPPPAGKTYQVWLIDTKGERTSGGFLLPEAGYAFATTVIEVPGSLAEFKGVGVTAEPLGGSPGPTGPRIFGVDF
jgi:anti-sigma-K factor RskA